MDTKTLNTLEAIANLLYLAKTSLTDSRRAATYLDKAQAELKLVRRDLVIASRTNGGDELLTH